LFMDIMLIQRYMNEPLPSRKRRISMQQHIIFVKLFGLVRFMFIKNPFIKCRNLQHDAAFYLFAS
jgi:hypothetical protein